MTQRDILANQIIKECRRKEGFSGEDTISAYKVADFILADRKRADLRWAYLRGAVLRGEKLDKAPIKILELKWDVLITKQHMKIGCEFHKVEDWWKFDNKRIFQMAGKDALVFWKQNKAILKKLWENHCRD